MTEWRPPYEVTDPGWYWMRWEYPITTGRPARTVGVVRVGRSPGGALRLYDAADRDGEGPSGPALDDLTFGEAGGAHFAGPVSPPEEVDQ